MICQFQTLDGRTFLFYTEIMGIVESIFDLLGYGISKQKTSISESIPTIADLEARVQELRDSESSKGAVSEQPSSQPVSPGKATSIASGCIPCSIGHLGTCSGLLNEAMRFARNDGVQSEEVISRVNMCLDELNALERVDLRPEMIHGLPEWEKPLAEKALSLSRSLRHDLEQVSNISTPEGLEGIAAKTQGSRQEIGTTWFRERLKRMTPEQREMVKEKLQEKFNLNQAKFEPGKERVDALIPTMPV